MSESIGHRSLWGRCLKNNSREWKCGKWSAKFQVTYLITITLLLFSRLCPFLMIGIKKWMEDIKFMFGFSPGALWQYMWMVATPIFVSVMFVMTMANYETLTYNRTYQYPIWGITIG